MTPWSAKVKEGLQHRLQIKRRPADHLQDFTGGGLLVEGFREIAIARLQLREQPHVLDRDPAWSAKVSTSSICVSVNGWTVRRLTRMRPIERPSRSNPR
jgi:hypothetical protein